LITEISNMISDVRDRNKDWSIVFNMAANLLSRTKFRFNVNLT
jgi:hypothetical protein